jgi:redox-sensitive bicupin YhaK (pirin superfamily)
MIEVRRAEDRGVANLGWLNSRHTFSFGEYYDSKHMGFGALRVINEDRVQPGQGFGTHGHRDMEIISYVLDGALEHKDSIGTGSVIRPGEVQRMSAGTGIRHSEFNHSNSDIVHFLQIWILPERTGLEPSYEQRPVPPPDDYSRLSLIGSRDGQAGSVTIHQDVNLYTALLDDGEEVKHTLARGRAAWLQVIRGSITVNGKTLAAGDGAAITDERAILIQATQPAELLLFDLAHPVH